MKALSALVRVMLFLLLFAGGVAVAPVAADEFGHSEAAPVGVEQQVVAFASDDMPAGASPTSCDQHTCVAPCAVGCCAGGACGSAFVLSTEALAAVVARQQGPVFPPSDAMGGVWVDVEHGPPRHRA